MAHNVFLKFFLGTSCFAYVWGRGAGRLAQGARKGRKDNDSTARSPLKDGIGIRVWIITAAAVDERFDQSVLEQPLEYGVDTDY